LKLPRLELQVRVLSTYWIHRRYRPGTRCDRRRTQFAPGLRGVTFERWSFPLCGFFHWHNSL